MSLEIVQIDLKNPLANYNYILHCPGASVTGVIDPTDPGIIVQALESHGWNLNYIINTHHHHDHVGGNLALKEKYGATVVGPKMEADKIPGLDVPYGEGDDFHFGEYIAHVIDIPGHTLGHIAYHFEKAQALFCGDTIFSIGCGRMFEGTPEQFWNSLLKLRALDDDTRIYCAHEYTASNGKFALHIDPDNKALQKRMAEVTALRQDHKPTVPSFLGEEKQVNPFLRADDPALREQLDMTSKTPHEVFQAIRSAKDNF